MKCDQYGIEFIIQYFTPEVEEDPYCEVEVLTKTNLNSLSPNILWERNAILLVKHHGASLAEADFSSLTGYLSPLYAEFIAYDPVDEQHVEWISHEICEINTCTSGAVQFLHWLIDQPIRTASQAYLQKYISEMFE